MRDIAKKLITGHEGLRLKPYKCTAGKWTIGVGRNLDDVGISEAEADVLLENDIDRVLSELERLDFWRGLDSVRQVVLVDMCFNLGWPRLSGFSKMLAAIRNKDYSSAAVEMLDSRWAAQVGKRAVTLSKMMKTGEIA
jgi:lysozyme